MKCGTFSQSIENCPPDILQRTLTGFIPVAAAQSTNNQSTIASQACHGPTKVAVITRNRPATLARCISSLVQATRQSLVTVFDDSSSPSAPLLKESLRDRISLRYVDQNAKRHYLRRLSKSTGLDPALLQFGFCPANASSYGANRNWALLAFDEDRFFMVDDDVVLSSIAFPPTTNSIGGDSSPEIEWWFGDDFGGVEQAGSDQLFETHNNYLGKPTDTQIANVGSGTASITVSGVVGDCACPSPLPYLLSGSRTLSRLLATKAGYETAVNSRHVLRCPTRSIFSRNPSAFLTMAIGLDARWTLPPFFPFGASEDFLFARLHLLLNPSTVLSYVPIAVYHDPPNVRPFGRPTLRDSSTYLNVPLLISALLNCYRPPVAVPAETRVHSVAAHLYAIATLTLSDFRAYCLSCIGEGQELMLSVIDDRIRSHGTAPAYWRQDMAIVRCSAIQVYSDWAAILSNELDCSNFRKVTNLYARLLAEWPHILAANNELRGNGIRLGAGNGR